MADQRVTQAAVLTDPTTSTQQAVIDASGHLQVDVAAGSATVTVDNGGTFITQVDGAALTALQLIDDIVFVDDAAFTVATSKGAVAMGVFTTDVVDAGDAGALAIDANRLLQVDIAADSASLATDAKLDDIIGDTGDIPNVIGTDGTAGPTKALSIAGTEAGGNLQELLSDADGHLQVDVLSGGGTDTPTNPVTDVSDADTPTNIAAGASSDIDSPDLVTKKLTMAIVAGSVPFKVKLQTLADGAATTFAIMFGDGSNNVVWNTQHKDYVKSGTGAGADGFRANVTNLDPADTADFYVCWSYED